MSTPSTLSNRSWWPGLAALAILAISGCGDDAVASTDTDGGMPTSSATSPTPSGATGSTSGPGSETTRTDDGTEATGATDSNGSESGETDGTTGDTGGEAPTLFVDFPLGRPTSVEDTITVRGHVTEFDTANVAVRAAGAEVPLDADGVFTVELPLLEGSNTLSVELFDADTDESLDVIEREVVRQLLLVDIHSVASGPGHDFVYLADDTHGIVAANKETGMRRVLATPDTTSAVVLAYDHIGDRLVLVDRILDTLRLIDPDDGSVTVLLADIPGFQISWARMDADRNRIFLGYGDTSTPPIVVDLDTGASTTFAPDAPWPGHMRMGLDPVNNRTFARAFEDWLLIDLDDETHQLVPTETLIGSYTAGYVDPSGAAGYRVRLAGSPVIRRVDFETWDETGAGSFPGSGELTEPTADELGLVAATMGNHPFGYQVDVERSPWDGSSSETLASNRFPLTIPDYCSASSGGIAAAGSTLFAECSFGRLLRIDLDDGAISDIAPADVGGSIAEFAYDAAREKLLVLISISGGGTEFEGIVRYDLRSGEWEEFIETPAGRGGHFDIDTVSDSIVVSGSSPTNTAVIYDAESGALTQVLNSINNGVDTIAMDADAVYYRPGATDFVNRYDRAAGTITQLLDSESTPAGGTPTSLQVDEEGDRLLAGTSTDRLIAIDRSTGATTTLLQGGALEPHESDGLLGGVGHYAWMPETQNFAFAHRLRVVLYDFVTDEAVTLAR